eukprot:gene1612-1641_t
MRPGATSSARASSAITAAVALPSSGGTRTFTCTRPSAMAIDSVFAPGVTRSARR